MDKELLMLMSNQGLEYVVYYPEPRDEIVAAFFYQDHAVEFWKTRGYGALSAKLPDNPHAPRLMRINCDLDAENTGDTIRLDELDDSSERIEVKGEGDGR